MPARMKFPYWEWEDYQAGLYDLKRSDWDGDTAAALAVLGSDALEALMRQAVERWPKAAAHHLTDGGMNQQAWLGWAACGLGARCLAHITRAAWWQLTEQQRCQANSCADRVISRYRNPYAQTLFDD